MSTRGLAVGVLVVLVCASLANGAPIIGSYTSIELGGSILDGRWSESYVGGGPGQIGDTVHAASWDGLTLAGMWEVRDPAIDATPSVLLDTRVGGTGTIVYYTTYGGGTLLLENTGPWWGLGDPGTDYAVDINSYSHTTTNQYVGGQLVASTTVATLSGVFQDYAGYGVSFWVSVAVPLGEGSGLPGDYPAFLPSSASSGAWGIAQKIRTEIVPEPASVLLLASGIGLLVARRRNKK
jgi:hypothetical protein